MGSKRKFEEFPELATMVEKIGTIRAFKNDFGKFVDVLDDALLRTRKAKKDQEKLRPLESRVHHQAVSVFSSYYSKVTKLKYIWDKKDLAQIKVLLRKVMQTSQITGKEAGDEERIIEMFRRFLSRVNEDYVLRAFTIGILVSQYNAILQGMVKQRKEQSGKRNNVAATEELKRKLMQG